MIFRIDELKDVCGVILAAVDSSIDSVINETIELKVENNQFTLNVTNREYYVKVKLGISSEEEFHATVNANLFLKLISKITTDTVELKIDDTNLIVIGNGRYKIPMIYDGVNLLTLPEISILNATVNFPIKSTVLKSINKYNTKQLSTGTIVNPIQKKYYIDENGAITFTSGACINKFSLQNKVSMLLDSKLVKLFNLFKDDIDINFTLGYDSITENIIQTKVKFETNIVTITSILSSDDTLIKKFPVSTIRDKVFEDYEYSVVINKEELIQTIDRLLLFPTNYNNRMYSNLIFEKTQVLIYDSSEENNEAIYYSNESSINDSYKAKLDLNDLKAALSSFSSQYVTMRFGNFSSIVIFVGDIYYLIPEVSS